MTSKALSDTQVRNLKPRAKPFKVSDGGGLHVLVTPSGGRLWRLAYRIDGKQQTLALGAYPAIALADARNYREQAKADLAAGRDPTIAQQKRKRGAQTDELPFSTLAEAWFEARKGPWGEGHRRGRGQLPRSHPQRSDTLRRSRREEDVCALFAVRSVVDRNGSTHSSCRDIFRYGKAEVSPAATPLRICWTPSSRRRRDLAKFKAHELPDFLHKLSTTTATNEHVSRPRPC
jgi:hypothetical protein